MKRETKNALLFLFCALAHFRGAFKIPWDDPYSPGYEDLLTFPAWLAGSIAGGLLLGFGAVRKKLRSNAFFPCLLLSSAAVFLAAWDNFRALDPSRAERLGVLTIFSLPGPDISAEYGNTLLPVCGYLSEFLLGTALILGVGTLIGAICRREFRRFFRPRLSWIAAAVLPWAAGYADGLLMRLQPICYRSLGSAEYGSWDFLFLSLAENALRWLPSLLMAFAACAIFCPLLERLPVHGRFVPIGMTWLILLDLPWAFPTVLTVCILPYHSYLHLTVQQMIYETATSWSRESYVLLCGAALALTLRAIQGRQRAPALPEEGSRAGCGAVRLDFLRGIMVPFMLVPAVLIAGSASNLGYPSDVPEPLIAPRIAYRTDRPAYPVGTEEISLTLESPPDASAMGDITPELQRWFHGQWYRVKPYTYAKDLVGIPIAGGAYRETVYLRRFYDIPAIRPGRYRFVRELWDRGNAAPRRYVIAEFEIVR